MNSSLVSIIIPSFNRADLIADTLDSILAQTYTNWECIVVDDGSIDETEKLLRVYCEKDARIQFHKRPNDKPKGGNVCRNYGVELSKGTYFKFLDSDDLLSDEIIACQVDALLESKTGLAVSTAKFNFFKDSIESIQPKIKQINKNYQSGYDLLVDFGTYSAFLPAHCYLVPRDILHKSGLWNENLTINQDGEFFVRVLLNASEVIHAKDGMVYYRFGYGDDNVNKVSSHEKAKDVILSWILIDTYIKIYNKNTETIQYVKNAKASLIKGIESKEILKEFDFFLERKQFNFQIKNRLKPFLKKIILVKNKSK